MGKCFYFEREREQKREKLYIVFLSKKAPLYLLDLSHVGQNMDENWVYYPFRQANKRNKSSKDI